MKTLVGALVPSTPKAIQPPRRLVSVSKDGLGATFVHRPSATSVNPRGAADRARRVVAAKTFICDAGMPDGGRKGKDWPGFAFPSRQCPLTPTQWGRGEAEPSRPRCSLSPKGSRALNAGGLDSPDGSEGFDFHPPFF